MVKDNGQCGVGVAYDCNLGGIKFNISAASDLVESSGLGRLNNYIQVYSNSWGPNDFGFRVDGPGSLTKQTLKNGAQNVCLAPTHCIVSHVRVVDNFITHSCCRPLKLVQE